MKQPELGKKIAELRKVKGLTQEELVDKCNINVRTLQRIEAGEVVPRSYTLKIIFEVLEYKFYSSSNSFNTRLIKTKSVVLFRLEQFYKYVIDLFNLKTKTMKKISVLTIFTTVIIICVFAFTTESNAQSSKSAVKIIEAANANLVRWFNNGEINSIVDLYSDDACILNDNKCGKNAVRESFSNQMKMGFEFVELIASSINVSKKIAVEKGTWRIKFDTGIEISGTYISEWNYINKKWLIVNDGSFTN